MPPFWVSQKTWGFATEFEVLTSPPLRKKLINNSSPLPKNGGKRAKSVFFWCFCKSRFSKKKRCFQVPGTRKLFVFMVHFQIHYDFHLYPNSIVNFQQKWSTFLMYHQPSFFSHAQQQEVWIKRWVRSFQLEFLGSSDMENIRKYRADTCPNHYIYHKTILGAYLTIPLCSQLSLLILRTSWHSCPCQDLRTTAHVFSVFPSLNCF